MTPTLSASYCRPSGRAARVLALSLLTVLVNSVIQTQAYAQVQLPTPEIYTCIDAKGRKLTSDRPILECRDREQNILNPSGTVKAHVAPTLTAKERNELEAKRKVELAQQAALEEEKRRDRALLVRYPSLSVHEKERAQALEQINVVKQTAFAQIADLRAQKVKLMDEMAFYEKDPSKAPAKLKRRIDGVDEMLAAQGRFMADKDAEAARINARFDAEQERLKPLWRMAAPTSAN